MIVARLLALALSHVPDQGAVDAITEAARAAQMTECARLCVDVTGEGDAARARNTRPRVSVVVA